jgi:C1A family cysteine protease
MKKSWELTLARFSQLLVFTIALILSYLIVMGIAPVKANSCASWPVDQKEIILGQGLAQVCAGELSKEALTLAEIHENYAQDCGTSYYIGNNSSWYNPRISYYQQFGDNKLSPSENLRVFSRADTCKLVRPINNEATASSKLIIKNRANFYYHEEDSLTRHYSKYSHINSQQTRNLLEGLSVREIRDFAPEIRTIYGHVNGSWQILRDENIVIGSKHKHIYLYTINLKEDLVIDFAEDKIEIKNGGNWFTGSELAKLIGLDLSELKNLDSSIYHAYVRRDGRWLTSFNASHIKQVEQGGGVLTSDTHVYLYVRGLSYGEIKTININKQKTTKEDPFASLSEELKSKIAQLSSEQKEQLITDLKTTQETITAKNLNWEATITERSIDNLLNNNTTTSKLNLTPRQRNNNTAPNTDGGDVPDSFDWTNLHGKNYLTPARSQKNCGSCTIFAAIGAFESRIKTYYNQPHLSDSVTNLSEQDVLSCTITYGCNGVYFKDAISQLFDTHIGQKGIVSEAIFPYKGYITSCPADLDRTNGWSKRGPARLIDNYELSVEQIKQQIMNQGPIAAAMNVHSDFYYYNSGIYENPAGDFLGAHAIVILGFGEENGKEYWRIKNSYGNDWGEDGFGKIAINADLMIESGQFIAIEAQPIAPANLNLKTQCVDQDNDGFCYWGLGEKPDNCPLSCATNVIDCDDSNASKSRLCGFNNPSNYGTLQLDLAGNYKVYILDSTYNTEKQLGTTPHLTYDLQAGLRTLVLRNNDEDAQLVATQQFIINPGQITYLTDQDIDLPLVKVGPNKYHVHKCAIIEESGTVDKPIVYELQKDIVNTNKNTCLDIRADNIIVDGLNHTITNQYSMGYLAINSNYNNNIEIKNFNLKEWHNGAVAISRSNNLKIDNIACDKGSISFSCINNSQISNLEITNTFNGLVIRGDSPCVNKNNQFTNITVTNSSDNIIISDTTSSTFDSLIVTQSANYGARIDNSDNNKFTNCQFNNNQNGLVINNSYSNQFTNCQFNSNAATSFSQYSGIGLSSFYTNDPTLPANRFTNCQFNNNQNIGINYNRDLNPLVINQSEINNNYLGIKLANDNNQISYSKIAGNTLAGLVFAEYSGVNPDNNQISNNHFENEQNFYTEISPGSNKFSQELTNGRNIVNSTYIGGNYWAKPDGAGYSQTCVDNLNEADATSEKKDLICDQSYEVYPGVYDNYPLVKIKKGDINYDGVVGLDDANLALKILAGNSALVYLEADVDGDGRIGFAESIYPLQTAAGVRDPDMQDNVVSVYSFTDKKEINIGGLRTKNSIDNLTDSCSGDGNLLERTIENREVVTKEVSCPTGTTCVPGEGACVDNNSIVQEPADLYVKTVDFGSNNATKMGFYAEVCNQGGQETDGTNFSTKLYQNSNPAKFSKAYINQRLEPGECAKLYFDHVYLLNNKYSATGSYELTAEVDYLDELVESNETNNSLKATVNNVPEREIVFNSIKILPTNEIEINYQKNFTTCVHLENTDREELTNLNFCQLSGTRTYSADRFDLNLLTKGSEVYLEHGNYGSLESNVVVVE